MSESVQGSTDLYRYFDADGRLLYVGISFSAVARAAQHRRDKGWWTEFTRMDVERFDTRQEALDAERRAIRTERPAHNVMGNNLSAAKLRREMAPASETARLRAEAKRDAITFVGKYCLTPPDGGEMPRVKYQGQVVEEIADRTFLVQLYSWTDGCPTSAHIFTLDDMRGWRFYHSHQAWLDAAEVGMRANDAWAEGRLVA